MVNERIQQSSWRQFAFAVLVSSALTACGGGGGGGSYADKSPTPPPATSSSSSEQVSSSAAVSSSTPVVVSSSVVSSSVVSSSVVASSKPAALVGSLTKGKTTFESTCTGCHGAMGVGATAPALNLGKTSITKNGVTYSLADFIGQFMPKSNPGSCSGQCAADVAAYISNGFSETYPVVNKVGYSLQLIDNCGENETPSAKSYVILDNDNNKVTGWNHAAPGYIAPYDKLSLTSVTDRALYDVPGVTASDSSCNKLKTQSIVLIKKYANWDAQHTNGIEPSIAAANKTFADADKIVIELKLNSAKTKIYSKAALKAIYGATLTDTQYDYLDQANAAFGVSFLGDASLKLEFQRFVELDPAIYSDRWVRITIPIADMDKFTGDPWVRTPTTVQAQAATKADRIRINPEVYGSRVTDAFKWGNVIRNFVPDASNTDAGWAALNLPETFKEEHVTIKKIEVVWK